MILLLLACESDDSVVRTTLVQGEVYVNVPGAQVLDPKLGGLIEGDVLLTGGPILDCSHTLVAQDHLGRTRTILEEDAEWREARPFTFDGLDDEGLAFDPGRIDLIATVDCGELGIARNLMDIAVVRLGAVDIDFSGSDSVPLAYHSLGLGDPLVTELEGIPEYRNGRRFALELADLDEDDGSPREAPDPWLDPDVPPWGDDAVGERHNVPTGQVFDTAPEVTVTFGNEAVSQVTGLALPAGGAEPPIVLVGGSDLEGLQTWEPNATRTWSSRIRAPEVVGYDTFELVLEYYALVDDEPVLIGTETTTHPRYTLAGQPFVPDGTWFDASPNVAWIGVLDEVNEAVAGLPAEDHFALMDALRDQLHEDPFLVYNPSDSAYSDFSGSYITWSYTWVEMSDWLARSNGIDLYCHSLACVLSSEANHLGLPAEYVTLAYNFQTHLTRAAGSDDWRRWSFNSHGVVTVDGGEHIWDAAVDYDGDEDPDNEPVTATSAKGVPFDEYLELLTGDDIAQVNGGTCFVF